MKQTFTQLRLIHSIPCLSRTVFSVSLKIGHQKRGVNTKNAKAPCCSRVLEVVITRGSLEVCKKRKIIILFDRPSGYDDERIETARSMSFQKTFRSKRVTKINDNERIGGGEKM